MGLLESLLNVPEQLRIWHASGIRYLLLPEQSAEELPPVPTSPPDPATWPKAWHRIMTKTPHRPRCVFAYRLLGHDLSGRADPRRGALWRRLISELGWTGRNCVAFWPPGLPEGEGVVFSPDIFRQGLSLLEPGVVVFFGDPGACSCPVSGEPGAACTLDGYPCLVLPDPEDLLTGDKEIWDHVLACLADT